MDDDEGGEPFWHWDNLLLYPLVGFVAALVTLFPWWDQVL